MNTRVTLMGLVVMAVSSFAHGNSNQQLLLDINNLGRGSTQTASSGEVAALTANPALIPNDGNYEYKRVYIMRPTIVGSTSIASFNYDISGDAQAILDLIASLKKDPLHFHLSNFTGAFFDKIGFGLVNNLSGRFGVFRDLDKGGLDSTDIEIYQDSGVVAGYSHGLLEQALSLGASLKIINRSQITLQKTGAETLPESVSDIQNLKRSAVGFGVDLGASYMIPLPDADQKLKVALALLNVGGMSFKPGDDKEDIDDVEQSVDLGISYTMPISDFRLGFYFDFHDMFSGYETNALKKLHLGADFVFLEVLVANVGLNQGFPTASINYEGTYGSFGLGGGAFEAGKTIGKQPIAQFFTGFSVKI